MALSSFFSGLKTRNAARAKIIKPTPSSTSQRLWQISSEACMTDDINNQVAK